MQVWVELLRPVNPGEEILVNYNYSNKTCNKIEFIRGKVDRSNMVRTTKNPNYPKLEAGYAEKVKDIDPTTRVKKKNNSKRVIKNRAFYTKKAMENAVVAMTS